MFRRCVPLHTTESHAPFFQTRVPACQISISLNLQITVNLTPNSTAGGLPLDCYPRLLIQYIRSYPPEYWIVLRQEATL